MVERRAFVTGWPIAHSRSPLIHGHWLAEHGIEGRYERVAVAPPEFEGFLAGLRDEGWEGGNVTIPHKEAAHRLVDHLDGDARRIGAVNTLWFEGDRLHGGNTDAFGFSMNLDDRLVGWRSAERAVVLGAGGAARAVVHALREAGIARVDVVNRDRSRAEGLAAAFGPSVRAHGLGEEPMLLEGADLVVNTRPGAKTGASERAALPDFGRMRAEALATDIVYVPVETPFLSGARERGLHTADGLGMLLHQAVPGFERWFAFRPAVTEELRRIVLADIEKPSA